MFQIWHTVRTRYHIVKALVELSDRADSVRLQGLARLTKVDSTSHEYSKIENIAISLVTLLQEGKHFQTHNPLCRFDSLHRRILLAHATAR